MWAVGHRFNSCVCETFFRLFFMQQTLRLQCVKRCVYSALNAVVVPPPPPVKTAGKCNVERRRQQDVGGASSPLFNARQVLEETAAQSRL